MIYPMIYLNKFWQCVSENRSVAISGSVLQWLGYDNINEYDNKSHFIELLKAHSRSNTQTQTFRITQTL